MESYSTEWYQLYIYFSVTDLIIKGLGWKSLMEIVRKQCQEYVEHEKMVAAQKS